MFNFDKNSEEFYLKYVNTELYRSKFTLQKSINISKVTFLDRVNKSSYWFPAGSGWFSTEEENKLRDKRRFSRNSTYSFNGFIFLSSFETFINSRFNFSVSNTSKSTLFLNYVSAINEIVRKQELKRNTQNVRMYSVTSWKYRYYNNYTSLKYYYNFEPHRNLIRIRKFNFLAIYAWIPNKRWLFTYRNMHNFYLKRRKVQKFEFKYFRAPGMSFSYWAKKQLQYNYFNTNSSDLLSDSYNSNIFMPSQVNINYTEYNHLFTSNRYDFLHYSFVYWLLTQIKLNYSKSSLMSHFSNSYSSHQVSNSTKYKYLKNFYINT